ncbi:HIT family hydrolase [Halanaeroarchaeum sp. HSR-CO]|uniref:HIT family protein n=1 Tax=Halanaeroarchaeum sp. HSR-CO TaxID=2866382 RepID=UPI00217CE2F5|nr:HIT domain-containing protein [Halanaeroarchaeum sp. HSR-CO]UWG48806.1 HIT family hydrolase [Halanaeroarchaeum sp. HSR-CO]
MDSVFAPWRIEWVERDGNEEFEDCVFCEVPEMGADREYLVVARNEHAFVMLNNYPYNPGHAMVIPFAHERDYEDLSEPVLLAHSRLVQQTITALKAAMNPDGINTGLNLGGSAAGGSIDDHLHTHVVPRWQGDTNFMPVISETKVIVEAVEDTYDRLYDAFANLEGTTVEDASRAVHL